jgi:hypothetical protein
MEMKDFPSLEKIVIEGTGECTPRTLYVTEIYIVYEACGSKVVIFYDGSKLGIQSSSPFSFAKIRLDLNANDFLAITLTPLVKYDKGYKYFNELYAYGKTDAEKPSEIVYPSYIEYKNFSEINKVTPCWTYPYTSHDIPNIIYPTVAILLKRERYEAYVINSTNGLHPSLIEDGLVIEGNYNPESLAWVLFRGENEDPYKAIRIAFEEMSDYSIAKLREKKPKPKILGKLGWCSWNAFLTDVRKDDLVKVVKGLKDRGIRLGYVLIDDGWQERDKDMVLLSLDPDKNKFPDGFAKLREELGVEYIGLWLTINLYWKGFSRKVRDELGEGEPNNPNGIPDDVDKALTLYQNLFSKIRSWGFSFVKVDNQWSIRMKKSPVNIQLALQVTAYGNSLEILNCMSMVPECYSNYFMSNIMRTSTDYIPMWKDAGKLHIMFNAYNSLFFSNLIYPDYDMFSTYDTYALAHLIARIFSGGPVYITDREVEKTNVELLRKVMLEDNIITVDSPGLITRDILFCNPYKSEKLLKIASTSNGITVLAAINVNEKGKVIREKINLSDLPFEVKGKELMYYKVVRDEYGYINNLTVELGEMEAEVVVITDKGTPIGYKGFLLPPATLNANLKGRKMIILDDPIKEIEIV